MKNVLRLICVLLMAMTACDDGDVKVDDINFENVIAAVCSSNNIIYKLSGNQALLLQVENLSTAFVNDVGSITLTIGGANQVRYRLYNGEISSASICDAIQPASPVVSEEWVAVSGSIVITTSIIYEAANAETGQQQIARYRHNIEFRNITFAKPQGNQFYETYAFGDYLTYPTALNFNFDPTQAMLCASTNTLYNARPQGREGIFISNFDPSLLSTENLGIAKTSPVGADTNRLVYRLFAAPLAPDGNENYFCSGIASEPATTEEWTAISGSIQVITTTNGGYLHSIRLLGVTFKRGNSTFYYGNDMPFGDVQTN